MKHRIMQRLAEIEPRVLLLIMGGILGMLALQAWMLLRPPLADYRRLQGERAALTQPQAESARLQAETGLLEAELGALTLRLQRQSAQLPVDQMVLAIIDRLDRIAARRGVRLDSVRPGTTRRVLMFDEVSTDIRVSGKYAQLFEWLRDAESELGPLVVTRFSMKRNDTASGTLAMELKLAAYRPVTTGTAKQ